MRAARRFVSSNFHELRVFVRRAELAFVPARSASRALIFSFPMRNRLQVIALRQKFTIWKQPGTTAHSPVESHLQQLSGPGGRPLLSDYHEDSETHCRVGCADVRSSAVRRCGGREPSARQSGPHDPRQPRAYS